MSQSSEQQKLQHLYWRAAFGPRPQDVQTGQTAKQTARKLLRASDDVSLLDISAEPTADPGQMEADPGRTSDQQRAKKPQLKENFILLNQHILDKMAASDQQLRERMTFFWHGHFAVRRQNMDLIVLLNNTLRQHALGKFGDLLTAAAKDPSMLVFLNSQQNRKASPNENFARELLELFTLGRGHYTEQDIKEAARAFTGWAAEYNRFTFRANVHDTGTKEFRGRRGNFTGDDILQLLLEDRRTATFITEKIYRYFVNEQPDPQRTAQLAKQFYESEYDIKGLMEQILLSDWFYEPQHIGSRIKSPVDLLLGLQRTLQVEYTDARHLMALQNLLGQIVPQPPSVAGWPTGRNWIDSASLLYRLRLPFALLQATPLDVSADFTDNDALPNQTIRVKPVKRIAKQVNLQPLQQLVAGMPSRQMPEELSRHLLQVPLRPESLRLVQQHTERVPESERLEAATASLMALPEYQLC